MTIETLNDHLVGVQGDLITMMIPATGPMTRDKALRLAAWLQLCADPGGERFAEIRDACANT